MAKFKRAHADHRADTRGGALSGFPHVVADSPAYLALNPFERAVLAEILRRFNGYNNGKIPITYQELGERLKGRNAKPPNNGRIARAVVVLITHGLIGEPTPESWTERRAREYRLTFISSGNGPPYQLATNEYLRWQPPEAKIDGNAGSPEKPQSGYSQSPKGKVTGDARSPRPAKNPQFCVEATNLPGDGESLLIGKPCPAPISGERQTPSNLISGPWAQNGCEDCGAPFAPANRGKPKRFCSEHCRKRAETKRHRQRQREAQAQ